jgi:antitoxin component YwqK of YwqJK toxin-antitoxin module
VGYHPGGAKKFEGGFVDGVAQGDWTRWWASGQKKAQGFILDGKWNGPWTAWDKDGRLDPKLSGTYTRGSKDQ